MLEIAIYHVKRTIKYKAQIIMDVLGIVLNFLMQFFIWKAVLNEKEIFFESTSKMALYYLIMSFLSIVLKSNAADIGEKFKLGKMDRELIRPISLFELKMLENIFANLTLLVIAFPSLFVIYSIGMGFKFTDFQFGHIFLFLLSVILSFVISFCIDFLIGTIALIIDEVWAVRGVISFCIKMVSGFYIPLALFASWFLCILECTPFYYIYYFPAVLLTNMADMQNLVSKLFFEILWAGILYLTSKVTFSSLIKRYTAFGG